VKIVYRYLFKKFLGPFALTFFFSLFVLLMQFLWKYVDDMVGKGLEVTVILELLFYASAGLITLAVPLAVLLSSLMTFGSLGEQYELIAMKSAGISIRKLIFSLSLLAVLIGFGSFWFSDRVAPKAYVQFRTLLRSIMDQKPTLSIEEGVFYNGFENYIIRIGKKDRNNVDIYDVLLFDHTKSQGNSTFFYAKRGKMAMTDDKLYLLLYLYDGFYWDENAESSSNSNQPLVRSTFAEQYKRLDLSSFKFEKYDDSFSTKTNQALSNAEIVSIVDTFKTTIIQNQEECFAAAMGNFYFFNNYIYPDSLEPGNPNVTNYSYADLSPQKQLEVLDKVISLKNSFNNSILTNKEYNSYLYLNMASYYTEWYRKYVFAVACIIFFFIGAPLGSIIRKGGIAVPLVITVAFFSTYFMFTIFGEKIAKGGAVPVWFGMWVSTLVLLPICVFLTYQATVDSALLSSEEFQKRIAQIDLKKLFSKKPHENTATHP
jgi:lipopolysaccharide export system permease protein